MWRERLKWFKSRLAELDAQAVANDGKLSRSDHWRVTYYRDPYLIRAKDEDCLQRLCYIHHNQAYITEEGEIAPISVLSEDSNLMRKFTAIMEEISLRKGISDQLIQAVNKPLGKYFQNGRPIGVELFKGIFEPEKPYFVKFSEKKKFVEQMLEQGRFRVSPASLYSDSNLLHAQQDLETERSFVIPCYDHVLLGHHNVTIEGTNYDIAEDDAAIKKSVPDYYLFSLCKEIDRRMPTDFKAEAALIVKDRRKFQRLFFDALRDALKGWNFRNGDVDYYDPYLDFTKHKTLEMTKHFRFHYQKEFRLMARPKRSVTTALKPFFIEIGPMHEYAEICSL